MPLDRIIRIRQYVKLTVLIFRVFGIAIAMSSFLNLLVPSATEIEKSFYVIIIRMCQGLVEVKLILENVLIAVKKQTHS